MKGPASLLSLNAHRLHGFNDGSAASDKVRLISDERGVGGGGAAVRARPNLSSGCPVEDRQRGVEVEGGHRS